MHIYEKENKKKKKKKKREYAGVISWLENLMQCLSN
jgi:hypothetical protein